MLIAFLKSRFVTLIKAQLKQTAEITKPYLGSMKFLSSTEPGYKEILFAKSHKPVPPKKQRMYAAVMP